MRFFAIVISLCAALSGLSQAIVFEGDIELVISNGTASEPSYLVIDNPKGNKITDSGSPGSAAILSESVCHIIKWNIGNRSRVHSLPFIRARGGFNGPGGLSRMS